MRSASFATTHTAHLYTFSLFLFFLLYVQLIWEEIREYHADLPDSYPCSAPRKNGKAAAASHGKIDRQMLLLTCSIFALDLGKYLPTLLVFSLPCI